MSDFYFISDFLWCPLIKRFSIALLILAAYSLHATTYYVDSERGNDSFPGTSETQPWQTFAWVNHARFAPGDQILLARGRIWREQFFVPSSGTNTQPLLIGAYGSGAAPLIDAQAIRPRGMSVVGKSYIEIRDIAVQNSASISIEIFNSSHITVRDCIIRNSKKTAISVGGMSPDFLVDGCHYSQDGEFAIDGSFVSVFSPVEGAVVSNNKVDNFNGRIAIAFLDVNHALAYGNVIQGGGIGIAINACSRNLSGGQIHDNVISNISTAYGDGEAIEVVGHVGAINPHCEQVKANPHPVLTASAEIYNNQVFGGPSTFGGIDGWHAVQCHVHGNLVTNVQKYGMQWTADSTDNEFAHNEIRNSGVAGIAVYGGAGKSSAHIHHNIIEGTPLGISADLRAEVREDYNRVIRVKALRSSFVPAGAHTVISNLPE